MDNGFDVCRVRVTTLERKCGAGQIRERASARSKVDNRRRSARILCSPRDICASRIFPGRDVGLVLLEPLE